jgi:hypothetical protein
LSILFLFDSASLLFSIFYPFVISYLLASRIAYNTGYEAADQEGPLDAEQSK